MTGSGRMAAGDERPDRTFFGAWWESADPDAGLDWKQIAQANPSRRLPRSAIATEYSILPVDSWKRERLNHFVDATAEGAFNPGVWAANKVPNPLEGVAGPYALGVHVHPGWERAAILVAARREDGRIGVEVHRALGPADGPITAARLVEIVAEFVARHPTRVIAYEQASGAASEFARHATESGLPYDPLKPNMIVSAAMDTTEMILAGRLAVDDPLLDLQVAGAARRNVGSMVRFGSTPRPASARSRPSSP